MAETKKFLDFTGLTRYDENLKGHVSGITGSKADLTTSSKSNLVSAINEVNSIAKGATVALSANSYASLISTFSSLGKDVYNLGQTVYIKTIDVPDVWISGISNTSSTYTYTTDAQVISDLNSDTFKVGYYSFSKMETQKVDLTSYATLVDLETLHTTVTGEITDAKTLLRGEMSDLEELIATTASGLKDEIEETSTTISSVVRDLGDKTNELESKKANKSDVAASTSVSNNNPTLSWNTTSTIGSIGGTNLTVKLPANPNTDTSVTAVGNHYTPSKSTTKSASGGTLTDIANSSTGTQVVTGVEMDAAGHVTGVTSVALKSTNTTYSSKTAASGGTDVSLVTTGEKYTWNGKQDSISDLETIRSNASTGATHAGSTHARTDATKTESSATNGNIKINGTETTVYTHPTTTATDAAAVKVGKDSYGHVVLGSALTKSDIGLGNVTNDSQVKRSEMGVASGVATLDSSGKVPSSQLPSYVDDVLEYSTLSAFPATGESGKIYIAQDTNKTYRWSGTAYVVISETLALGETSSTAYYGDKGKTAYEHSQATHARTDANNSTVSYDTTNKKITKTVNGSTSDVVTASTIVTDGGGIKSHQTVTDNNPTLSWGTKSKVATIGSTEINVTMPANPNTDTKNTAGSTDSSSKLFIIGATSQAANPQTYSQDTAYIGTDGHLYSNGKKTLNTDDEEIIAKAAQSLNEALEESKSVISSALRDLGELKADKAEVASSTKVTNNEPTLSWGNTSTIGSVGGTNLTVTMPSNPNSDTKNTAGATDSSSKLFLIGATSQGANPQTYSQDTAYVGTDGCLYSGNAKVLTSHQTVSNSAPTLAWDTTSTIGSVGGTSLTVKMPANPNTDTKNTAGSTDSSSKLFLIGATSQAANPQTYSQDTAYVGTDGKLYSGGKLVLDTEVEEIIAKATDYLAEKQEEISNVVSSAMSDLNRKLLEIDTKLAELEKAVKALQ